MDSTPSSAQYELAKNEPYYGNNCPTGKVQIEFVGCAPAERYSDYGWKPVDHAFIEIYIDGQRFRLDVGNFHDGVAGRRGIHIVGPIGMGVERTAMNAASLFLAPEGGER